MTGADISAHPNLVAHLKLDAVQEPQQAEGQAKVLDSLGRTEAAADVHGRPKLVVDQRFGTCLRFNHAHEQPASETTDSSTNPFDYLQLALEGIDFSQGFSFSCWMCTESNKAAILDSGSFGLYIDGGYLKYVNMEALNVDCQIKEDEWAQLTVSVQSNGDTQLFVNGLPIAIIGDTKKAGSIVKSHPPWKIGMYDKNWLFKGKMARIRFYNVALHPEEIHRQWSLEEAIGKPLPFSIIAPVDFEFWDEQHQPIIYTQGGEVSHKLSVALWNKDSSKRPLAFAEAKELNGDSIEQIQQYVRKNHHIELRFPGNTLSRKSTEQLIQSFRRRKAHTTTKIKENAKAAQTLPANPKEDWLAFYQNHPELNAESIYLISTAYQTLEVSDGSGEPVVMEVVLPHLTVESGAYSVPVELCPGPLLSYQGEYSNFGKRIRNLQIQTQKGHKTIPLHFGVVGSNSVINDGTQTKLLLRLTNIDSVATIKIKDSGNMQSQFILSCDLSKHGGHHEWALTDEAAKVTVEVAKPGILQPDCQLDNHWQSDPVEPSPNGDKVEWIINGSRLEIDHLGPNESVYCRFSVKTNLATGPSDLHLHYRHIEGYWDGNRSWTLEKSPLVFFRRQHAVITSFASRKELDATYDKKSYRSNTIIYETSSTPNGTAELRQFARRLNSQVKVWTVRSEQASLEIIVNGKKIKATQCAPSDKSRTEDLNKLIPHLEKALGFNPLNPPEHIGIGTNHPASKLSVTDGLTIGGEWAKTYQAPTSGLLVEGKVGFGTHHPEARLHVHQGRLRVSELAESATIELKNNQHTNVLFTDGKTGHLNIRTNSKARHVALQCGIEQGNVGIGKSDPQAPLHVVGSLGLESQGTEEKWNIEVDKNGSLLFNANYVKGGDTCLIIDDDSGNVGMGTTATQAAKLSLKGGGIRLAPDLGNKAKRPKLTIGSTVTPYEIRGAETGYENDGFLRLRAGGGGNASSASYIDISGFSTISEMSRTIVFGTGGKERMRIDAIGNIGIGTSPTKAKLEIYGCVGAQTLKSIYLFKNANHFWSMGEGNSDARIPLEDYREGHAQNLSIYANYDIAANGFASHSDARIKTIEGRSDGEADLAILSRIEITDYLFKDVIAKGAGMQKKAIAQQIESFYPQAVNKITDVVPDIYEKACVKDGWIELMTDLKVGERVRLIGDEGAVVHEVLELRSDAFRVDLNIDTEELFIYGREVKDFCLVDYDAISMLNVSATQELARRIEAKNLEIEQLKTQLNEIAARLTAISVQDT
jgi:hypothetical protein